MRLYSTGEYSMKVRMMVVYEKYGDELVTPVQHNISTVEVDPYSDLLQNGTVKPKNAR